MNGVAFDDLRWLNLLWVVLAALLACVYAAWQRRRALHMLAAARLWPRLTAPGGRWRGPLRAALALSALTLLVIAILGPRWGEREQRMLRRGIDVLVLLDVSRSMLARDIAPSRLERAKISLSEDLLPALGGDRIGLMAFAGSSVLVCPLTTDYGYFRLALADADPRSVGRGGTLIGDALRRAGLALKDQLDTHRVILLITDGEDPESAPVEAARKLWDEHQIPVVPVALGDPREGARVPVQTGQGESYLEYRGETVWSRSDFEQLRQIAAASPLDRFIPVGTRDFDLGQIYRESIVPSIRYREREEVQSTPLPSQYHVFALAALLLLLVESALREGPLPPVRVESQRSGITA